MPRTLYISYFGVREPLVQTQVLPYLREIGKLGAEDLPPRPNGHPSYPGGELKISLLTFEPRRGEGDLREFEEVREALAREGIEWDWLPYHKRFSAVATAWDVFRGAYYIWRRIGRFDILHGRAHVAALMGAIARKFSRQGPKLLFDIRGFIPEEYTDAGIWPEGGVLYRMAKRAERWLMREADAFVVLTNRAREILAHEIGARPVEVIPCCVDFGRRFSGDREKLRAEYRERLGVGERKVIVHLGALGGLYLTEEIVELMSAANSRQPGAFALFLTQSDPQIVEPLLLEKGFGTGDYFIGTIPPAEIEGYLYASDIGVSFVKATFATASRSPTKIPEYLACGLPIIANAGVGDVDALLSNGNVGALISDFSQGSYKATLESTDLSAECDAECRSLAVSDFDLVNVGGERYRNIYKRVLSL